jgi:hypothetical protein
MQWVLKLINQVYFQLFPVIVNATKNPKSNLNRENYFQPGFVKIIIVTKFPKTGFLENPNYSFSAPRHREISFVLTA